MSKRHQIIVLGVIVGVVLAVGCYVVAEAMARLPPDHPTYAASPTKRRDSIGSGLALLCIPIAFGAPIWIAVRFSRRYDHGKGIASKPGESESQA